MLLWPLVAASLLATRWAEDLPRGLCALAFALAIGVGLWRARVILGEPVVVLELLPQRRARWTAAGRPLLEGPAAAHEQWPVTTVRFAVGGTTVVFWPDTLCASGRRLLRRWARSATPVSPLPQFWMG